LTLVEMSVARTEGWKHGHRRPRFWERVC
jgi:hypothetical protein